MSDDMTGDETSGQAGGETGAAQPAAGRPGDQPAGDQPDGDQTTGGATTDRRVVIGLAAVAVVAAIVLIVALATRGGDDEETTTGTTTATTAPATTAPATTAPATTVPATTAPPTTAPATTAPATTAPATTAPATTAPPDTTAPPAPEPDGVIPENDSGWTLVANPGVEDITAGPVVVYWYRSTDDGNYLAVYTGQGIAESAGLRLCPGNSLQTADGFESISNAATEEGACEGFPTDEGAVQVCSSGVWVYETLIPGDGEGLLWGSLEWNADGTPVGMSSQAETMEEMPEFEAGLASYAVPPWFTSDGSTVVECAEPIARS